MCRSSLRCVVWIAVILGLAGCAPAALSPTPLAAVSPTSPRPTVIPTAVALSTLVITPTPTWPSPLSTPVSRPASPMSPLNAAEVNQLAQWEHESVRVALSPDGTTMAAATSGGALQLWRVAEAIPLRTYDNVFASSDVSQMVFSPDGTMLALASGNAVTLWQVSSWEHLRTLSGHKERVRSVAFSPDGTLLASASQDRTVRLWQVENGKLLRTLEAGRNDWGYSVVFSPDGTALAAGMGSQVWVWRVSDGTLLRTLEVNGLHAYAVAFSPDGATLAAGDGEYNVWLWRAADGAYLRRLVGHTGAVSKLAFSPDGTLLASGSADGTIRLWRVEDGAPLRTLSGSGAVTCLAFDPGGALLVSSSVDRTVRFWGVGPSAARPEPRPTPSPNPALASVGSFHPVTPAEGLPQGRIRDLWVAPDGRLWAATEVGIFLQTEGQWTSLYKGLAIRILGADDTGKVWAILNDGQQIAAYDPRTASGQGSVDWSIYGAGQGWTPVNEHQVMNDDLAADRRGWVWLVTGADLRRFDGERWTIYTPEDIGYKGTAEDLDTGATVPWLTDVVRDDVGDIWVSECGSVNGWPAGQGVRWFDGQGWGGAESPVVGSGCVQDIEVDEQGGIWLGVDAILWRYSREQGWVKFPLPPVPQESGRSWGWVDNIELDPEGNPWLSLAVCGGASCGGGLLYRLRGETWTQLGTVVGGEENLPANITGLAFAGGVAWLTDFSPCSVYRVDGDVPKQVATFEVGGDACSIEADAAGRVWVAALDKVVCATACLWWLETKD